MSDPFIVGAIVFVVLVLLVLLGRAAAGIKGAVGESRVRRQLRRLEDDEFEVLNDLLVWTSRGSTQIDHVVVSRTGIFVLETKNFTGWIHGSENSEYWTQTIYRSKTRFRNPIKQNWAHVFALKEVLSDLGTVPYHPIVVFVGRAELKNVNTTTPVIYSQELLPTILRRAGEHHLTSNQVSRIARILREADIQDRRARQEHVNLVHARISRRRRMEQAFVCPECGGTLVERNGRYGRFFGCSGYPRCRYTLPYKSQ